MEKHIRRPKEEVCDSYYTTYIDQVKDLDFMAVLQRAKIETPALLAGLNADQWRLRYQHDKWTVKEVLLHVIDTERIFAYRALRIARDDQTPMAGFDQNDYVPFSDAGQRTPTSIIEEYQSVRNATLSLFRHFNEEMYLRLGTASGKPFTPLSIGFIIAGHEIHHLRILKEKYLG